MSNNEHVGFTGSKSVVDCILDVDNVETTVVTLTVSNNTDTTHVTTTSGHDDNTSVEADKIDNLSSRNVDLDCVVDLDGRIRITNAKIISVSVNDSTIPLLADQPKLGPTTE